MIVVIADDLTGAAELGGLGARYGLVTEITTSHEPSSDAQLLVIATDTRSLSRQQAEAVMEQVSASLHRLQPAPIFKKIDSVLRGHVLAEINIQKNILRLPKALIVSANPGKGRTIVDGMYLLHGEPIHSSSFSQDPEFPVTSSRVPHMLAARDSEVLVLKHQEPLPDNGIIVGEVKEAADLAAWSRKVDTHTLVAGAAEFFEALLNTLGHTPEESNGRQQLTPQSPFLAIWGSSFRKSRTFVQQMKNDGFPVHYMPAAILQQAVTSEVAYLRWVEAMTTDLERSGKAGMAIDPTETDIRLDAVAIRNCMADAAALITARVPLKELLIEGGATAATVLQKLNVETLYPETELAPGVTRMLVKGKDRYITVKPGSYDWPQGMFQPPQTTHWDNANDPVY